MANQLQFVWFDGKLVAWHEATVHVTQIGNAGVSSVFEGIRAYWNAETQKLFIFQLDAHLDRLMQSMRLMRMKHTFTTAALENGILELVRANQCATDIYIRPLAYTESAAFSVGGDQVHLAIHTTPMASHLDSGLVHHACISSWTRISDNVMPPRVKASSNYLNSRLASEEAKRNGYDTALLLNPNGKVTEAPGACLMLVRDGKLITPAATNGILESITRATVIELCRDGLRLQVIEREVDRTELYVASEAFTCGTGGEITPIVSVDRLTLGDGSMGAITRQIEALYHDVVRGVNSQYDKWRTKV